MSMKRKTPYPVPPGIKPPGIKKKRMSYRRKRQNILRSLLARPQIKYHDVLQSATEANYDSVNLQLLNGVSVGDTDETRDGQQILMNSLQIKGLIRSDTVDCVVRYLIILDKMPNEATLLPQGVIETSGATSDVYRLRLRSASAQSRYKVMLDKCVALSVADSSASGGLPYVHIFDHYFKMADIAQFNDDGTGNTDDFQKGALYFFATSDIASASTGPTVEFASRITFFDK